MGRCHDRGAQRGGGGVIELGVFSLAELTNGAAASTRIRDIITYGIRSDEVGLDVFGLGEHHTPRFSVSSPAIVLAAIAARTSTVTLTSAVSVLSVLDPVRLYQDFAQLDLVSGGRAEITAGRSAYQEPFDTFGVPIERYEAIFDEKLELLLRLRLASRVTWHGEFRSPLKDAPIVPDLGNERVLPVRLGVGGTPASAVRAARLGLPMTLALLLGNTNSATSLADAYWQAGLDAGYKREQLSVGIASHFHVGATSQSARDAFYPSYRNYLRDGRGVNVSRSSFDELASPHGALMVGSPQEVIDKIMLERELTGLDRFIGQVDLGGLPAQDALQSVELFGAEVAPVLRRET